AGPGGGLERAGPDHPRPDRGRGLRGRGGPLRRQLRRARAGRLAAAAGRPGLPRPRRSAPAGHLRGHRTGPEAGPLSVPLRRAGRLRRAGDGVQLLHLLVHRGPAPERADRGGAHHLRGDARPPDPRGPVVGGYRGGHRGAVGQLPANLFAGRHHQLRGPAQPPVVVGAMSRLIVVSNRVNVPKDSGAAAVGGMATAMAAALRKYDGVWFGWSGETAETFTGELNIQEAGGVTAATVDPERQDDDEHE